MPEETEKTRKQQAILEEFLFVDLHLEHMLRLGMITSNQKANTLKDIKGKFSEIEKNI